MAMWTPDQKPGRTWRPKEFSMPCGGKDHKIGAYNNNPRASTPESSVIEDYHLNLNQWHFDNIDIGIIIDD